jgi:hypothetical protein
MAARRASHALCEVDGIRQHLDYTGSVVSIFINVEPRGFEPLPSAVQRWLQDFLGVSRCSKSLLSKPDSRISGISLFIDVFPGNCQLTTEMTESETRSEIFTMCGIKIRKISKDELGETSCK